MKNLLLLTTAALTLLVTPLASAQQLEAWVIPGEAERPYFEQLEASFNETFADQGLSINIVRLPSYNDTLRSAFITGDLPDIIMIDGPDMANYVWSGLLAPLDDVLDEDILADLLPAIREQGTYGPDGRMYSISPYDSTVILWGNRSYLEEAGVRIPTGLDDAWTMDEFEEALGQLAELDEVVWPLDIKLNYTGEWLSYGFSPFIQSAGADLIDRDTWTARGTLDSDASIEALSRLQRWVQNEWVVPAAAGDNRFFSDKTAALVWVGNWMWPFHREGLGDDLVLIPAPNFGVQPVSPNGGWSWAIPSASQHPEEAGMFINYAMSTEQVAQYADFTGYIPARASAVPLSEVYSEGGEGALMAEQAAEIALVRPVHPAYPVISQAFGEAIRNIVDGADVRSELERAARAIDEDILDNDGYPPFDQ